MSAAGLFTCHIWWPSGSACQQFRLLLTTWLQLISHTGYADKYGGILRQFTWLSYPIYYDKVSKNQSYMSLVAGRLERLLTGHNCIRKALCKKQGSSTRCTCMYTRDIPWDGVEISYVCSRAHALHMVNVWSSYKHFLLHLADGKTIKSNAYLINTSDRDCSESQGRTVVRRWKLVTTVELSPFQRLLLQQ